MFQLQRIVFTFTLSIILLCKLVIQKMEQNFMELWLVIPSFQVMKNVLLEHQIIPTVSSEGLH